MEDFKRSAANGLRVLLNASVPADEVADYIELNRPLIQGERFLINAMPEAMIAAHALARICEARGIEVQVAHHKLT